MPGTPPTSAGPAVPVASPEPGLPRSTSPRSGPTPSTAQGPTSAPPAGGERQSTAATHAGPHHPGAGQPYPQPGFPGPYGGYPGAHAASHQPPRPFWSGQPARPTEPTPTIWERLSRDGAGSRILAWAGGAVTLAGVVLLLILAIQRGYLGPLPRVLLGAGLGLVLTGIGTWLHRTPTARTGAYALAATGIAVVYLAVVAATTLYHFLPAWGGLATGLVVTAAGIALAGWWDSQLLAVFVVVCCAVSAPVIAEGFGTLLLCFLLVLQLGTTPVQLARKWNGLLLAAAVPPVIVCFVRIGLAVHDGHPTTTAVLAGVTSGITVVLATATALRRPDDEYPLVVLLVAAIPGLLAAVLLPRLGATILPAAVGVLLLGVWVLGRVSPLPGTFALAAGGIASLAFLQATATGFDGDARAIAFLAEALILTAVAVRLRLGAALLPAGLFALVGFVLGLTFAARPDLLARPMPGGTDVAAAVSLGLTGALFAAVAITLCWAVFRLGVLSDETTAPHGWVPAGLVALYGSTAALLAVGLLVSPGRDGFLLGHVLVTVSWTVAALALLLRGIDSVPPRVAGLSLVVAALAKLVLFDLSSLDGMARVVAFLVAGLVLLGAGARYARLVAARTRS
ncbi:DUF2339 domain-containing protein [Actinophytocola oryzae]|uniref:DUF2339 domain-containing protein n=1 Tax=Actinophytocola oryzae TaxID=502181 RepID=UPI0014150C20|nr:DUF2339 domain-containing protein [Actinophytocola oryzae]